MSQSFFGRIAYPTSLERANELAFYHAVRLAQAADAAFDILHVGESAHLVATEEMPDARRTLAEWDLAQPASWADNGHDGLRAIATYGREPVGPILDYMDESLPDLLVLATHRRGGLERWLHKEIATKLARSRAASTLFVPFKEEGFVSPSSGQVHLRHVLLPIDWSPPPQAAIDAAAEIARVLGCEEVSFTLLHVAGDSRELPAVKTPHQAGWTWEEAEHKGDVVETILEHAHDLDADLVVMTTQGHDGFLDALRGSTTERVLHGIGCPLLAVPAVEPEV